MTDEQVEAARLAVSHLRCSEAGGCFAPSGVDAADDCAAGDCYCTRQADREARAALSAAKAVAWLHDMGAAPRNKPLLGVVHGRVRVIQWGKTSHVPLYGWCLADQGVEDFDICNPTAWRPLPEPPK